MQSTHTRTFILTLLGAALLVAQATSVRGTLRQGDGGRPALELGTGESVYLEGDADTMEVLTDERLRGADFEVVGERLSPDRFRVGPMHKKSMWVHRDGKKLMITYWCDVCAIRTYTPGVCMCCQQETELDLLEPENHISGK